jgi:hypothetical protein
MPGSVRTRPSQLSVHSILRAKALPGISGNLSIKSTHDYIFYFLWCEILSGLLWRSVFHSQHSQVFSCVALCHSRKEILKKARRLGGYTSPARTKTAGSAL